MNIRILRKEILGTDGFRTKKEVLQVEVFVFDIENVSIPAGGQFRWVNVPVVDEDDAMQQIINKEQL